MLTGVFSRSPMNLGMLFAPVLVRRADITEVAANIKGDGEAASRLLSLLAPRELHHAIRPHHRHHRNLRRLFQHLETSRTGFISRAELHAAVHHFLGDGEEGTVGRIVAVADTDTDDIDYDEFEKVVVSGAHGALLPPSPRQVATGGRMHDTTLQRLFYELDIDGDGAIELHELRQCILHYFDGARHPALSEGQLERMLAAADLSHGGKKLNTLF
eukprot:SAG11_NODE_206_length_12389_cov_11.831192_2_plen_215_part_00